VFDGDGVACLMHAGDLAGGCSGPLLRSAGQARTANASFRGFARCGTEQGGNYLRDHQAGAVPDPDGKPQAPPHCLAVFGRGMLRHLYTRIYFSDEAGNAADPVLALVPPTAVPR